MLSDTIRQLREERGWSQYDLADRCGTSQQNIGRYENGTDPKSGMLKTLSAVFGVTVSYLLGLDDDPKPHGLRLAPEEQHLIDIYRSTDERGRAAIMAVAESQRGNSAIRTTRSAQNE